jgi:flagellar biosynthesis component FlhA
MVFLHYSLLNLNRAMTQPLIAALLATMGILCGVVPQLSWNISSWTFSGTAYTQEFNDNQVANYAKAVLLIETQRQQSYQQIQQIIGHQPPEIVCNRTETLRTLPTDAQKVAVQFCNNSKKIAENSGLTTPQFNAITERAQQDPQFKRHIQDAMIRLRRQP